MLHHLLDDLVGNRSDIRTSQSTIRHMNRITHRSSDNFGLKAIDIKDVRNGTNQINARSRNIVQTAQEGANIRSACTGCQQSLVCGENQSAVRFDAFRAQNFNSLQTFNRHRNLNNHVGMQFCNFTALSNHALSINRRSLDLARDRSINNRSDFFQNLIKITALFGNQAGVCSHATNNAHVIGFANIFNIRGINKKLHCSTLPFLISPEKV